MAASERSTQRRRFLSAIGVVALCGACPTLAYAQRRPGTTDQQIVDEARRVAAKGRVELYQHGVEVDGALAEAADRALAEMERILGRPFDEATLGRTIRVYVAAGTTVSHVWRGYEHPSDPRAIVFLNPMVARLALTGRNATYAHELAHLLTWRFRSHTLREGLADYLALQLHPGAGVGPNVDGYASPPPVHPGVDQFLGTTRPPPPELTSDATFRRAYYHASHRFVAGLVRQKGLATFMELYDSADPEAAFERLYGKTRGELVVESGR